MGGKLGAKEGKGSSSRRGNGNMRVTGGGRERLGAGAEIGRCWGRASGTYELSQHLLGKLWRGGEGRTVRGGGKGDEARWQRMGRGGAELSRPDCFMWGWRGKVCILKMAAKRMGKRQGVRAVYILLLHSAWLSLVLAIKSALAQLAVYKLRARYCTSEVTCRCVWEIVYTQ